MASSTSFKPRDLRIMATQEDTTGKLFRSELYIPVKRQDKSFDDLHMSRLATEAFGADSDADFAMRRLNWERRLDEIKRDFFKFSPFSPATSPVHGGDRLDVVERSRATVVKSPSGRPEFSVQFDVKDFKADEVNVSTSRDGQLVVSAKHEMRDGSSTLLKEYRRAVDLPQHVQPEQMRAVLSADGILSITAPIEPPVYGGGSLAIDGALSPVLVTQQLSPLASTNKTSVVERSSGSEVNYSISVLGYAPEEVSISVQGHTVKVHAVHDENSAGRKVHNEMKKQFDLPPSVDPGKVRAYIKDGRTLFVEAAIRENLQGTIQVLPVRHE